jgi:uncharacterized protein (TIGR02270 family)
LSKRPYVGAHASVIDQYVDSAIALGYARPRLVLSPAQNLSTLSAFDDRLEANLEALQTVGTPGQRALEAQLIDSGNGSVFPCAVGTIMAGESARLDALISREEADGGSCEGVEQALGWVSAVHLRGIVSALLASGVDTRRRLGLAACMSHRVSPGSVLADILTASASQPDLLQMALEVVGTIGLQDYAPLCAQFVGAEDTSTRFEAASALVMLGDRERGPDALFSFIEPDGAWAAPAAAIGLRAVPVAAAHGVLQRLRRIPGHARTLIAGAGIAGDSYYVPWLIKQMEDPKVTRLAGESFSFITGLDLAYLDLERKPPEGVELGPTDNPEDENVAMDPDDGLPWPDPAKIEKWWDANKHRFQPGVRYFMGEPVNVENCKRVLREGYQRQRRAAALYLSLLQPGTPLFNTSAPAWRQQRLLAKMT